MRSRLIHVQIKRAAQTVDGCADVLSWAAADRRALFITIVNFTARGLLGLDRGGRGSLILSDNAPDGSQNFIHRRFLLTISAIARGWNGVRGCNVHDS
jgi:hypothetical protein